MKAIIQKELGLPTVEISDQKATIDGGDVLFTGIFQMYKNKLAFTVHIGA